MSPLNIRAVIFDMDGLVLDSEAGYFLAWRYAAKQMGYELDQSFCHSLSGTHGSVITLKLMEHFGEGFDIKLFYNLSGNYWREHAQHYGIPVKTGFFVLLQRILELNLPFCLATNSRLQDAIQSLNWAGLSNTFSMIISRDDVVNPKPAPDVFLKAADALNLPSRDCLVLEDSPVGIVAAVAAACPCVFVPSIHPIDESAKLQANLVLSDLGQVADFISVELVHSV